jgi:hypothetical protein
MYTAIPVVMARNAASKRPGRDDNQFDTGFSHDRQ